MTTTEPAGDNKSTTSTTNTNTKTNNTNKSNDDGGAVVKCTLVARSWQRPIPDTNPKQYERLHKGAEVEVTEKELEVLNAFKVVLLKVEE